MKLQSTVVGLDGLRSRMSAAYETAYKLAQEHPEDPPAKYLEELHEELDSIRKDTLGLQIRLDQLIGDRE